MTRKGLMPRRDDDEKGGADKKIPESQFSANGAGVLCGSMQ
jgi:hypothetical protein